MITSDEPGIYREGFHGVRHENMILCVPAGENEFGRWLSFETLTLTYLDVTPLVIPLMERRELEWLNQFNNNVFNTLKPYLDDSETEWLASKTKAINIG